jgi:hypothetical protein
MKRLLVLGLALVAWGWAAEAQTVTARVGGELTGFAGSAVTVPIVVDMSQAGGAKLGSYTARLQWDPAVLGLSCSQYGCDTLSGNFPAPQINPDSIAQGVVRFASVSAAGVSGLITLVRFRFVVQDTTSTASSPMNLSFSEMSAAGTFEDLMPLLTVTSGTFCAPRGRWGDLDRDGRANSRDALVILSAVVGQAIDPDAFDLAMGDVDGDGKVNTRDALIILSYGVGLEIPGQRVLLLAPRACATGSPRQLALFPPAAELTPKQKLRLLAQAVDSAGRPVAVPDAVWRSSDNLVAGVDAFGVVSPRAPGTAIITAEVAPGLKASATITVIARRPNWYVDLKATGAPLQLGTAGAPFQHPTLAFSVVGEGDTIRVAPGTYFFSEDGMLEAGAVIIGGTPGDTTTRPVFRDLEGGHSALVLRGGQRTVVRNIVFDNFDTAIDLGGGYGYGDWSNSVAQPGSELRSAGARGAAETGRGASFALEDSRIVIRGSNWGYGIYHCGGDMDTVRVDRSVFIGDSTYRYGTAIYYSGCARVAVTSIRDTKIRFWNDAVYLYDADSTAVLRSEISDNDGYGLFVGQEYAYEPSLYVAHSRIERNYYESIYASYARRLVVDSSVVRATEDDGIVVYGACCGPSAQVYLRGDSIYLEGNAEDYLWLDAEYLDSLVVDGTVVRFPADTNFLSHGYIYADKAWVTNSKLLNIGGSSQPFRFYGRQAVLDNVEFTGCNVAGCDGGYGPRLVAYPDALRARIQNSRFSKLRVAAEVHATKDAPGTVTLIGNAADSVRSGFLVSADSAVASDNAITRAIERGLGILLLLKNRGPARGLTSVLRNRVTCTPSGSLQRGIDLYGLALLVDQDTVIDCRQGISLIAVLPGTTVQRTVVRNPVHGIWVFQSDSTTVKLFGNAISGADTSAVYVGAGRVWLRGNNIRSNDRDGLVIPGVTGYVSVADSNAFVGNARYAIYAPSDSVDARYNWWGLSTGPGSGVGADSVLGPKVVTSPFLDAEPAGLPGLAPPIAAALRMAVPLSTLVAAEPPTRARNAKAAKPVLGASTLMQGLSSRQIERVQRQAERRAQRAARDAERERQREAERAVWESRLLPR